MTETTNRTVQCKHKMRICPECGATWCKGPCSAWTQAGGYELGNAISGNNTYPLFSEITEKELCGSVRHSDKCYALQPHMCNCGKVSVHSGLVCGQATKEEHLAAYCKK